MWGHWCQVTSTNPAFTGNLGTSHYVKLSYSAPQWINAALKIGEKKSPACQPIFFDSSILVINIQVTIPLWMT